MKLNWPCTKHKGSLNEFFEYGIVKLEINDKKKYFAPRPVTIPFEN